MSKKVLHVRRKDGTTWCGDTPVKTKFDAKACAKCASLVRESLTKPKS